MSLLQGAITKEIDIDLAIGKIESVIAESDCKSKVLPIHRALQAYRENETLDMLGHLRQCMTYFKCSLQITQELYQNMLKYKNLFGFIFDTNNGYSVNINPTILSDDKKLASSYEFEKKRRSIHHIGNVHKYARNEDVPEHIIFVITTYGMENASHKYSSDKVKNMIERQKEQYGWEFLFIGTNIDAVETAARYGTHKDRAVNYNADKVGTHILYESVSAVVGNVRANKSIEKDWNEELNEDYKRRGKKNK